MSDAEPPPSPSDPSSSGSRRRLVRRVNTAERRASHNAVERQRRETLNGRFLDLAAILPNLSQIRRPSKSAIVNSSIALFNASQRHRATASRELRMLKLETDALRRELNDWRDRASIRRAQEPTRSDAFSLILSGELEIMPVDLEGGDAEDDLDPPAVPPDNDFDHPFDGPSTYPTPPLPRPRHDVHSPQTPYQTNASYPVERRLPNHRPLPVAPNGMMEHPYNGMGSVPMYYPHYSEVDQSLQDKWTEQGSGLYNSSSRSPSFSDSSSESRNGSPADQLPPPQYYDQNWNGNGIPNPNNLGTSFGVGMM
ncbi:hypothetical protein D9757_000547 [Collybiopsis confluens]|uniref:BHLH domain-containing protein n=1 Tax=Collybiopsis confluens TaxID=2823264 RepID=A0A8H5MGM8_9AGAR|nr:hypothetical protein D9757_000547 [Collybiopsis confluens]